VLKTGYECSLSGNDGIIKMVQSRTNGRREGTKTKTKIQKTDEKSKGSPMSDKRGENPHLVVGTVQMSMQSTRKKTKRRMTVCYSKAMSDCEDEKDAALIQLICKW
jgi:hypothetical protein